MVVAELTRNFEREGAGYTPSHQIVRALRLHAPDEPNIASSNLFQGRRQRRISDRGIEQLQRINRLFRPQIFGQAVVNAGVVDRYQGPLRTVWLNFDHLTKIEFAQIDLCEDLCEVMQRGGKKQSGQFDAASEFSLDPGQHP